MVGLLARTALDADVDEHVTQPDVQSVRGGDRGGGGGAAVGGCSCCQRDVKRLRRGRWGGGLLETAIVCKGMCIG